MRFLAYTTKISEVEISVKSIVEKVKAAEIKLNFMIATPIVEIITIFKAFFDEVRTGVTRFKVRSSVAKRGFKRDKSGKVIITNTTVREHPEYITVRLNKPKYMPLTWYYISPREKNRNTAKFRSSHSSVVDGDGRLVL